MIARAAKLHKQLLIAQTIIDCPRELQTEIFRMNTAFFSFQHFTTRGARQ
jgi:hypothetical protein